VRSAAFALDRLAAALGARSTVPPFSGFARAGSSGSEIGREGASFSGEIEDRPAVCL